MRENTRRERGEEGGDMCQHGERENGRVRMGGEREEGEEDEEERQSYLKRESGVTKNINGVMLDCKHQSGSGKHGRQAQNSTRRVRGSIELRTSVGNPPPPPPPTSKLQSYRHCAGSMA